METSRNQRFALARLSSRAIRFIPIVIATACGGRTAIDDELGFARDDDGGGRGATGGRSSSVGGAPVSSGGTATGGTNGDGGRSSGGGPAAPSGGASAGGNSPAGGAQGTGGAQNPICPPGTWGDGDECELWSVCEPGQYLGYFGTSTSDAQCFPCPPESYTASSNEFACTYSGCTFSERVITPATSSSHAACEPDPDYADLGPWYAQNLLGLVARGTRAYAGIAWSGETELRGYQSGTSPDVITIPRAPYDNPRVFTLAPDGTIYLGGSDPMSPGVPWVESLTSDLSTSLRAPLGSSQTPSYFFGLHSTSSHWIHFRLQYGPLYSELVLAASPHPDLTPTEARTRLSSIVSLAAVDPNAIWIVGAEADATRLYRMTDFAPPLVEVDLPENFVPALVTVDPSGHAYVVASSQFEDQVELVELTANGLIVQSWLVSDDRYRFAPRALAVDPGRALFIASDALRNVGDEYPISGLDGLILRLDLVTGEVSPQPIVGPGSDWVTSLVVTEDGAAYVAGETDSRHYVRRVF